ncbi:MAG: hypothetical protein ABDH28_06215 [Brevinematia bacterium]
MRKVLVVLVFLLAYCVAFGAVKFKGDLIGIGDFKYMESNFVYNNRPTEPYFAMDNVEFIVNFETKLELTSDVYGIANLIVQPTVKFKHFIFDSLMISYFHKASKVKIVPFYRYRVVRFDDPENSVGWFNSWVISSSVMGVSNVMRGKVDANGFYFDSSSTARAGGIPYILRPVEFMDGTIVNMPGMGEDTTNLSLVGRDLGGFYAEQRGKGYLWQVFMGSYFIDGSEGRLSLNGFGNVKIDLLELEDIGSLSLGLLANFCRFSAALASVEFLNSHISTIPEMRPFAALYNYGAYLMGDTEIVDPYLQFVMNSQGELFENAYNEVLKGGGYRISGGGFSDVIPGMLVQLNFSYASYYLVTNTNQNVKPESAERVDLSLRAFGEYETIVGVSKFVLEACLFNENKLNRFFGLPEAPAIFNVFLFGGRVGKVGVALNAFEVVDLNLVCSYESIDLMLAADTNKFANVTKIGVRGRIGFDFSSFLVEGLRLNIDGGVFTWNDNLRSSRFTMAKYDSNLLYYTFSPNLLFSPSEIVSFRIGYGYPVFGNVFDIDYGLIADSLPMGFYKNLDGLYEGIYGWYVLQNLPRVYVDLKISF